MKLYIFLSIFYFFLSVTFSYEDTESEESFELGKQRIKISFTDELMQPRLNMQPENQSFQLKCGTTEMGNFKQNLKFQICGKRGVERFWNSTTSLDIVQCSNPQVQQLKQDIKRFVCGRKQVEMFYRKYADYKPVKSEPVKPECPNAPAQ
jgi:hypothetical protein